MHQLLPVRTLLFLPALLAAALLTGGCGDDDIPTTNPTPPTQLTDTFEDTLTPFSARVHVFVVQAPGTVNVTLTAITPEDTVVGLDLGTWNGVSCQITIARPATSQGGALAGTATTVAQLCVRVYDVNPMGLPAATPYVVTVNHF